VAVLLIKCSVSVLNFIFIGPRMCTFYYVNITQKKSVAFIMLVDTLSEIIGDYMIFINFLK
jgi:hypothetical protein